MDIQLTEPAVKHIYIYCIYILILLLRYIICSAVIVLHSSLFMKHISQYLQIIVYTQYILSFGLASIFYGLAYDM